MKEPFFSFLLAYIFLLDIWCNINLAKNEPHFLQILISFYARMHQALNIVLVFKLSKANELIQMLIVSDAAWKPVSIIFRLIQQTRKKGQFYSRRLQACVIEIKRYKGKFSKRKEVMGTCLEQKCITLTTTNS